MTNTRPARNVICGFYFYIYRIKKHFFQLLISKDIYQTDQSEMSRR